MSNADRIIEGLQQAIEHAKGERSLNEIGVTRCPRCNKAFGKRSFYSCPDEFCPVM